MHEVDHDLAALGESPREQFACQRVLQLLLDDSLERTGPIGWVVAEPCDLSDSGGRALDLNASPQRLFLQVAYLNGNDLPQMSLIERMERLASAVDTSGPPPPPE